MFAEPLESRRLLTASFAANGVLTITATTGNDIIAVSIDPANTARLKVSEGGVVKRFERSRVTSISATLLKGHDFFSMADSLAIPTSIVASGGRDTLFGGAAKDTLVGGESEDSIDGRGGNDLLIGSQHSDDLIGGSGTDTVSYEYVTETFTSGGVRTGFGVIASLDGVKNDEEASGLDRIDSTVENIIGSGFKDELTGNGKANVLSGVGGPDSIVGNAGNDILSGGKGVDSLVGGSGNDSLDGGDSGDQVFGNLGTDAIKGGAGGDTFSQIEFDAGELEDYVAGTDVLV